MSLVQNFPFLNIIMCLASGVISSVLPAKKARAWTLTLLAILRAPAAGRTSIALMIRMPTHWMLMETTTASSEAKAL